MQYILSVYYINGNHISGTDGYWPIRHLYTIEMGGGADFVMGEVGRDINVRGKITSGINAQLNLGEIRRVITYGRANPTCGTFEIDARTK